jgi:hypothetical protein
MKTKLLTLSVLSILILAGASCSSYKKTSQTSVFPIDGEDSVGTQQTMMAPKACGEDLACGNELLAACNPGSFSTMDGGSKVTVNITGSIYGKSGGQAKTIETCIISSALNTVDMAGFIDKYDLNKDGLVDMECKLPATVKDFAALTAYVKTPAGIATCTGEMKIMSESLKK